MKNEKWTFSCSPQTRCWCIGAILPADGAEVPNMRQFSYGETCNSRWVIRSLRAWTCARTCSGPVRYLGAHTQGGRLRFYLLNADTESVFVFCKLQVLQPTSRWRLFLDQIVVVRTLADFALQLGLLVRVCFLWRPFMTHSHRWPECKQNLINHIVRKCWMKCKPKSWPVESKASD